MPHPRLSSLALTAPVAMGYVPLGAVFGFLFVQAGGTPWVAVAASVLVYAGAAQYMMIPMLAAGLSVGTIALATLILNLRHLFYGLSLLSRWPQRGWLRWYLMFGLTDETYSVLTSMPPTASARQMAWVTALNQAWWVLGTAMGAAVGAQAQIPLKGLDFVLATLFAVLTVEQWRGRKSSAPLWVALGAYGVAYALWPQQALVLAIALSIACGAWMRPKTRALSCPGADA